MQYNQTRNVIWIYHQTLQKLHKMLQNEEAQFHTFKVLRGMPMEIKNVEIEEDLKEKNYPTTKVTRMQGRDRSYPQVLVEIKNESKSIYNPTNCYGLKVEVKAFRRKPNIVQCHRCQWYGRVQKKLPCGL